MSDGYKPTSGMKAAANRALKWKEDGKATGAGTSVGWTRAGQLSRGETLSLSTVKRMFSFFSRHEVDKKGEGFYDTSNPSNGRIMWDAWGGDAGFSWSRKIVNQAKTTEKSDDFDFEVIEPEPLEFSSVIEIEDDREIEKEDNSFSIQMEVIKAIPQRRFDRRKKEYRFIKSIVMTPRKIDKQDDWIPEEEIEDGIHEFMMRLQEMKEIDPEESGISYRHQRLVKSDDAVIVENTFTDFPETWNGKTFPAGSWKVGIRVYDESMFPEIDRGELRGCSIEGTAVHTKEPLP